VSDQNPPGSDGFDQHGSDPRGPGGYRSEEPSDVEHTLRLPDQQGPSVNPGQQSGPPQYTPTGPASYGPGQAGYPASSGPPTGGYPQGGPSYGPGPQGYAGYGAAGGIPPSAHGGRRDGRTPRGLWPVVCVLALLVGLIGGAIGGAVVEQWNDANQGPGRASGGLADVDTVAKAPLPADNGSIASVAKKLLPSTVQIIADFEGEEGGATGSGFFLDRQGHVVTNNHVVQDAAEKDGKIEVIDSDGKRYDATVVGRSPVYDLAVLFLDKAPEVTPASLGTSRNLQIGEGVVAIGSPLGLSSTVTSGIVSALDRPVTTGSDAKDLASYINAVQTDAAINPGNSGGPLVDMRGQVVGVNSAIATTGGSIGGESGNIGVGFAIPIEQVKVTADQILKDGEARYPVIGASVNSDGSGSGALIQSVENGSPAEEAGLKKGDKVVALDDRAVTDSPTLIVAIRSHLPGDEVTLTVNRGGDEKKIDITLDSKVG
jgi:putative serine protease PepD